MIAQGSFNNYVDQILSNFDPQVGNYGHFTNYVDFLFTTYFIGLPPSYLFLSRKLWNDLAQDRMSLF